MVPKWRHYFLRFRLKSSYDHRTPQQPNGAGHGSEIAYVFKNLGGPVLGGAGPATPPRPQDIKMADLMSSFWTNFAKTGNPNSAELPVWPAFSPTDQSVMFFDDAMPGARPVPNIEQIKALDSYYVWRRDEAKAGARARIACPRCTSMRKACS